MKLGGLDSILAAKILTIGSFVALPSTLFWLGRRLGLSRLESVFAASFAGIIVCGENYMALYAVGLQGLFEVGLYTHTLGFIWFCLWCGSLPYARRRRRAAVLSVLSLVAILLTNIHVLPLTGAYGAMWIAIDAWRTWRSGSKPSAVLTHSLKSILLITSAIMIAGVWLIPLFRWHSYVLGQAQAPDRLFAAFGMSTILLLPCLLVVPIEWRRNPALAALCLALLLAAVISLLPLDTFLSVPFQPWRLISVALLLATIPAILLCSRLLRLILPRENYLVPCLVFGLVLFSVVQPHAYFNTASLNDQDARNFGEIRQFMQQLPPGMTLVEILDLDENSPNGDSVWSAYEQNASRALAHQLAMDGRSVIWAVFREQAVSAPFATAVRNLFSTTPEKFGLGGVALELGSSKKMDVERSVLIARRFGVAYYLVKSAFQVLRLSRASEVHFLCEIAGWYLFASTPTQGPIFEEVRSIPVVAWLPARFRDRSESQVEFFNISEFLAFQGHPEVCMLWGSSPEVSDWNLLSGLPKVIVIVDPSQVTSDADIWLRNLMRVSGNLKLLLLNDSSTLAHSLQERRNSFAGYDEINLPDYREPSKLIGVIADHILSWQDDSGLTSRLDSGRLWQTNMTYFPAWKSANESTVWLTGQGGMAIYDSKTPSLFWNASRLEVAGIVTSLAGIICALINIKWLSS